MPIADIMAVVGELRVYDDLRTSSIESEGKSRPKVFTLGAGRQDDLKIAPVDSGKQVSARFPVPAMALSVSVEMSQNRCRKAQGLA